MSLRALLLWIAAVLTCALSGAATAQSTFRISQLFSNLDGSVQYVSLTESAGLDNQGLFKGLTLTITHAGVAKQFTFPDNLATVKTAHLTIVVATTGPIDDNTGHFIVQAYPDFVAPVRFVASDGGTVDFAGFDQATYPALPADGTTAWYRDGTLAAGTVPGSYGCRLAPSSQCPGTINPTPTRVTAIEYYSAALDRYFTTASAAEIDALDAGRMAGWQRTGETLLVAETEETWFALEYPYYAGPVCRFYLPPDAGDSHFLSASTTECAAVSARFPGFVKETDAAFFAAEPDLITGECGDFISADFAGTYTPVYRLWSGRADGNHRYTTSGAIRDAMIAQGWVPEGYGPNGVAMCI